MACITSEMRVMECGNILPKAKYHFIRTKCFKNGNYFGEIIGVVGNKIEVQINTGNMFMDGKTITFITQ